MSTKATNENQRLIEVLAENTELRARIVAVEAWAAENEIAAPPLDWAGLGAILHGAAAADTPGREGGWPVGLTPGDERQAEAPEAPR